MSFTGYCKAVLSLPQSYIKQTKKLPAWAMPYVNHYKNSTKEVKHDIKWLVKLAELGGVIELPPEGWYCGLYRSSLRREKSPVPEVDKAVRKQGLKPYNSMRVTEAEYWSRGNKHYEVFEQAAFSTGKSRWIWHNTCFPPSWYSCFYKINRLIVVSPNSRTFGYKEGSQGQIAILFAYLSRLDLWIKLNQWTTEYY